MRLPWAFLSRPKASGSRAEDGQRREWGAMGKGVGDNTELGPTFGIPSDPYNRCQN